MMYLIWSNQHGMWWRPNERGYTDKIDEAGKYSKEEAIWIVNKATCDGRITNHITYHHLNGKRIMYADEIMIRTPGEE